MSKKNTVTEAQAQSDIVIVLSEENSSFSNCRNIPYVEHYQAATGLMESPGEHLEQAARDEERRKSRS